MRAVFTECFEFPWILYETYTQTYAEGVLAAEDCGKLLVELAAGIEPSRILHLVALQVKVSDVWRS